MEKDKKELMPGKITTIGILMVISGILIILTVFSSVIALFVLGSVFLLFFGLGLLFYALLIPYILILAGGIVDIIFGIRILMGKPPKSLPVWSPIMEIVFGFYLLLSLIGIIILGIGIANLILLLQDDSRMYFYKRSDRD